MAAPVRSTFKEDSFQKGSYAYFLNEKKNGSIPRNQEFIKTRLRRAKGEVELWLICSHRFHKTQILLIEWRFYKFRGFKLDGIAIKKDSVNQLSGKTTQSINSYVESSSKSHLNRWIIIFRDQLFKESLLGSYCI